MKRVPVCLSLLVILFVAGCTGPDAQRYGPVDPGIPAAEGILRIGVAPDYPPVIFKRNNQLVGLEADLARRLAEELEMQPVFREMAFTELIPALLEGKIDIIMSGMTITDQRAIRVAFMNPYLRVGQTALIRNEDIRQYDHVGILIGKPTIGVERGTTGALFAERNCRQSKIREYSSADRAAKALIAGQVDVVIHDVPQIWWLASTYEDQGLTYIRQLFTQEYLAWAMLPENHEQIELVNAIIARWQEDGTIARLSSRWIPQ